MAIRYTGSSGLWTMDAPVFFGGEPNKNDGRKVVCRSLNPITLLRNANLFTYIALALILLVLTAIVLITRAIVRRVKRKKKTARS